MDYDENDFQSQNFQIGGEDSKFSTNIRSFALPKFDLDEHLRFDSLVETEVLLGMQGQANNWIDFPSGTTAVEFSSSSAVSCSLSRHNNVWSEASSSESVDLLLKSMGEDEMMNKSAVMDSSANEPYEKKNDVHNLTVMDEGQRELLTHLQNSSQAKELKTVSNIGSSNRKYNPDDQCLVDKNIISKGRSLCNELLRATASNVDKKDSCVVASHCSLSSITCKNQDDNAHKIESMVHVSDETSIQVLSKSEKDTVGLVSFSCRTEPSVLVGNIHNKSFGKLEGENDIIMKEFAELERNSDNTNSEAILKSTDRGRMRDDFMEGSDTYNNEANQNSSICCDSGLQLISCLDAFSKVQCPEGQSTDYNSADIETESKFSIQTHNENQVFKTEDCYRMTSIPEDAACEKPGLNLEGKTDADVDDGSQKIKVDGSKDSVLDDFSVIASEPETKAFISPSSSFKAEPLLFSMQFQKESVQLHLPSPENGTDIDMTVEKKGPLMEAPFVSQDIVSADEDFKLSRGLTSLPLFIENSNSKRAGDQESVSYPSNMKDSLPIKLFQGESELKKEPSSSSNVIPVPIISEVFAVTLSGNSMLNDSKISVNKETMNLGEENSDCVEGTLGNISAKEEANVVVHFPTLVKSFDFTSEQSEVATSRIEAVKNEESVLQAGSCSNISASVDNTDGVQENYLHVGNKSFVHSVAANLPIICSNVSSHISLLSTFESDLSDRQGRNPRPSGNMVLGSSTKNEISPTFVHNSNDLKSLGPPAEARNFTLELSTSADMPEIDAICKQKAFPSLLSNNTQGSVDQVKASDISAKPSIRRKIKSESRPSVENKTGSKAKFKKEAPTLKQSSETDVKFSNEQQKCAEDLSMNLPIVEQNSNIETCTTKTSSIAVQTSTIPDLNSLSSALFQQSFTDKQQVQLRAQIFVYGAINSGIPPDEAYMVSAFGDTDGGRKSWEGLLHALTAKPQNQESPASGYETPSHYRSSPFSAKSCSKMICSAELNSTSPFLSPLWSLSYPNGHSSFPRNSYFNFNQTTSPVTPWRPSQFRPHLDSNSPWISQSLIPGPWLVPSHSSQLTESVQHLASAKELCRPHIPTLQSADPILTSTPSVIRMETSKKMGILASNKPALKPQKARKLKCSAAEEPIHTLPQSLTEPISSLSGTKKISLLPEHPLSSISPLNLVSNPLKPNLSEETCSKIELAKLHAEDAAATAASSIMHCQAIWSQLAAQKKSGLVSQIEEKLASAAVAAAAAASVAKAAAAAGKIAFDVALQAKMMADEAISAAQSGSISRGMESSSFDVGKKLAGLTPISILKGMDKANDSVEVISAAREAAKRRIESASAATKHAENLDAIVKAAELAAAAVAQAGTIVAMGGPLPFKLGELVDAGSEEFWKTHHSAFMKVSKWSDIFSNVKEHGKQFEEQFSKDEQSQELAWKDEQSQEPACLGGSSSLSRCHEQQDESLQGDVTDAKHNNDHFDTGLGIRSGSLVEVMSNEDALRGSWFSARIIDMKDNKAYVCYNDVSTNEGLLKEWISLENEIDKAPRIRTSNFATSLKNEGTRKRRREHLGSYIWTPGDQVEAWIHDRWWEGTVAEKCSGDETKLTVYISAKGDNQVVHTWNVRPLLIWNEGQWMESSLLKGKLLKSHESDTPQRKRHRSEGITTMADSEVPTILKNSLIAPKKSDNLKSLTLSAKDTMFSMGNSCKVDASFTNVTKRKQGLQKEGSRVVFGVPRPGKKRKFMEVSKHYVADKCEKISKISAPIKFTKYLMPQSSQKSKDTTKVENKGKNFKSIQGRSQPNGESKLENNENAISSFCHNPNFDKTNTFKFSSFSSQAEKTNIPVVESIASKQHQLSTSTAILTKKNITLNKNKGLHDHGKAVSEAIEPRRSNRRIQPTSRLLEGIQSSLIISKISSISHEKKSSRG